MNVLDYHGNPNTPDGKESANHFHHRRAVTEHRTNATGRALRKLLDGWQQYAQAHESRFEDTIGNDYVIGPYWADVGLAIKRLLDGDTGGIDAGSVAHNIVEMIHAQGIETDGYTRTGDK